MTEIVGRSEGEPQPCAFCEIRDGKLEASIITENDDAFAFMAHEGHPLVITKTHITAEELKVNLNEITAAYKLALSLIPAVKQGMGVEGISLVTNLGEAAGQEVPHLHIHMIGRNKGDRRISYRDVDRKLPRDVLNALAENIQRQMKLAPGSL